MSIRPSAQVLNSRILPIRTSPTSNLSNLVLSLLSQQKTLSNRLSQRLQDGRHHYQRTITATAAAMSDDSSYLSFLSKANAPVGGSSSSHSNQTATSQHKGAFDPSTPSSSAIPPALQALRSYTYTSDTDENFEPVLLPYGGAGLPSASEFAAVVGAMKAASAADVEEMSASEWDARGQHGEVVEGVRQVADQGQVKVYRVASGATRCAYYIVGLGEGGKLIGVVVKAVES